VVSVSSLALPEVGIGDGPSFAAGAITNLFAGYCDQIEQLIGEANYRDAFTNLQDFVRDFCPGKKRNVLTLCSRYHRWKEAQSLGLPEPDNINVIVNACLDLVDDVRHDVFPSDGKETGDRASETSMTAPVNASGSAVDQTAVAKEPEAEADNVAPAPADEQHRASTLDQRRKSYFATWRQQASPNNFVVFQCRDLVRGYADGGFRLGPISLELRSGEITAIVGRNASGKTTFLRLLHGDLKPDSGHATYPMLQSVGDDWIAIKEKIAFVPQLPDRWYGRLRNNLNYVAATYGARGAANKELVDWQLARYGLSEYENAGWDEISGGYKIRFELARALVSQPKLLVLDEPLAYLDIITRQKFLLDLRSIASSLENPIPIVVTSQHLYEIEAIADQLVILDDGNCVFAGHLDDIAKDKSRVVIEISLQAQKAELVEALKDFEPRGVEETIEGYIIVLPPDASQEALFGALRKRFGNDFYAFRDISRSTRSLMSEMPGFASVLAASATSETGTADGSSAR
jgi:ABC-2 type transport system ATP-binding protein